MLCLDGFGTRGIPNRYGIVNINVCAVNELITIQAVVVDDLPNRLVMPGRSEVVARLVKHGLDIADPTSNSDICSDLTILLGIDNYFKFVNAEEIQKGLYAIPSKIGTLIAGSIQNTNSNSTVTTVLRVASHELNNTGDDLHKLWDLDQIGINMPNENNLAVAKFQESITFSEGKYVVSLPWKDNIPNLPTNRTIALKRLHSLHNSLSKKTDCLKHYHDLIMEQLQSGFIERINDDFHSHPDSKPHYIPHNPVFKDSQTTPLRIVYDCSCKASKHSPSLNDCLLTGPSLLNDLVSILLRFKLDKYACTSDIKQAFLMVGLNERDR